MCLFQFSSNLILKLYLSGRRWREQRLQLETQYSVVTTVSVRYNRLQKLARARAYLTLQYSLKALLMSRQNKNHVLCAPWYVWVRSRDPFRLLIISYGVSFNLSLPSCCLMLGLHNITVIYNESGISRENSLLKRLTIKLKPCKRNYNITPLNLFKISVF